MNNEEEKSVIFDTTQQDLAIVKEKLEKLEKSLKRLWLLVLEDAEEIENGKETFGTGDNDELQ